MHRLRNLADAQDLIVRLGLGASPADGVEASVRAAYLALSEKAQGSER